MKIYIIGGSGVGKTTLSRYLAKRYNVQCYELDKLIYDDDNNHIRRSNEEIDKLFNEILANDSWIIEDVGRDEFIKGRKLCDKIFYIKLSKIETIKRVVLRWFRQKIGNESYNYPPTLWQFYDMLRCSFRYIKKEKNIVKSLVPYMNKVTFLDKKGLNKLEKN